MKAFLLVGLAAAVYARSNDGFSSVSRTEDSHGNYQFNYDITDWDTNRKRWEVSDAYNNRRGGYSITDVDGKVRHLEYVADKGGFRAVIRTNEPGTAPGYSGDALYVNDGVKQIITAAQPALQLTGHVIKQKKLALQPVAPVLHQPVVHQPIVHQPIVHQPVVQPVVKVAPPQYHQVYQHIQPVVHQPVVHKPVTYVQPQPVVYQQPQPVVYQQPQPVVYQQPQIHYQTYQQPIVHVQPQVITKPVVYQQPLVQKIAVQPVVLKATVKPIVVTSPPAYHGPRRRPQKFIEDPALSFETPELPKFTPKRVPGYNPGQDDFEDDDYDSTVPPPLSRSRVAYAPEKAIAISKYEPIYVRAPIIRKSGFAYPPLAGPPSRRARA